MNLNPKLLAEIEESVAEERSTRDIEREIQLYLDYDLKNNRNCKSYDMTHII